MATKFSYQADALDLATQSVAEVELTPRQSLLVESLGAVVGPIIGMPETVCCSFWLLAVRDWQKETGQRVGDMERLPPEMRLAPVKQIAATFTRIVVRALEDPNKERFLERAIAEAMQVYLLRFWKRVR